jgi:hypothetical protein
MEAREAADVVNDFGRDPIGEGKEEQVCCYSHHIFWALKPNIHISVLKVYNKKLKTLLGDERDDAPRTAEMGENKPGQTGKKGRVKLEDLTRYTMVKRIW